jgi:hypothetical protein
MEILFPKVNRNKSVFFNETFLVFKGAQGSSFYSPTNSQVGYPGNVNPSLTNKDAYNPAANINPNQYGLNNNNNNNPYPNTNTYVGQQVPNTNNAWPNNNNNNQYHSNTANTWGQQNRDLNANTANNNNNNNAYSNPNSPYFYNNSAHQMMTSCFVLILSFLLRIYFHI